MTPRGAPVGDVLDLAAAEREQVKTVMSVGHAPPASAKRE